MNNVQPFLFGFMTASLVGILSSALVGRWNTVEKTRKRMFVNVPKPALKPIPGIPNKSVGTDPDQSPIDVLRQGCTTIMEQLILQVALMIAIGVVLLFGLQQEITEEFFVGIIFAAIAGFLLQRTRWNWKRIIQIYKMITTPPNPSLRFEAESPPNSHYTAAVLGSPPPPPLPYPPLPPFDVLVKGSLEISWRLVWHLILFYLWYQSFAAMYFYLRGEPVLASGMFGV